MNILIATIAVLGTLTVTNPDGSVNKYSRGFETLAECESFNEKFKAAETPRLAEGQSIELSCSETEN